MDKSTHQIRKEQWAVIIRNCLASGQKKSDWCRENGINVKSFYYWQRILRNETFMEQKLVPSVIPSEVESPVAFVELKQTTSNQSVPEVFRPDVVIKTDSVTLEISNTASKQLLKSLGGLLHAQ